MLDYATVLRKEQRTVDYWQSFQFIFPYIWSYRGRVLAVLLCLIVSKIAIIGIPLSLKEIVDALDFETSQRGRELILPIAFLVAYGALRFANTAFNELRDTLFARVRYRAMRRLSQNVLQHLHDLSLQFHLGRETGAIFRDLGRGTQSISAVLNYLIFSFVPIAVEFILVTAYLFINYPMRFGGTVLLAVLVYVVFTILFTDWRVKFRYQMNELDSEANNLAVDSVINYETVKYFNNEQHECRRYAEVLKDWEDVAVKSQATMSVLNLGQGLIIAAGVTVMMIFASKEVLAGRLSMGDLMLVNVMLLQLFMPLGMLGVVYRALRYAFVDMGLILNLLSHHEKIEDSPDAQELVCTSHDIVFENLSFSYIPQRQILNAVSFEVPAGGKIAIVGHSGAGKSTLARLLLRFYEAQEGSIRIGGQDIRKITQSSLRQCIGVVPQDTVLFNRTLYQNILYGNPHATKQQVLEAAELADLDAFIQSLPDGYDTLVGERGLKLSGGEKQKVAIARAVLKSPSILVFDEATSNLDSGAERNILDALNRISQSTTTLVIAHRLSTIVDADSIVVLDHGSVVESGYHEALLKKDGLYAKMWQLQQREQRQDDAC